MVTLIWTSRIEDFDGGRQGFTLSGHVNIKKFVRGYKSKFALKCFIILKGNN